MLMICKGKLKKSLNPVFVTKHPNTFVLIMEQKERRDLFAMYIFVFILLLLTISKFNLQTKLNLI